MATYYGTYGQKVQYLASDPSDPQTGQVWYNSTSAVLKVRSATTVGTWAAEGNLNTARYVGGAIAPSTATLVASGNNNGPYTPATEKYNGTSWTNNPTGVNTARAYSGVSGTQTAALLAFGIDSGDVNTTAAESFNGSTWTTLPNGNTSRWGVGSAGTTNTAALVYGGDGRPASPNSSASELWNGSSWTNTPSLNTARSGLVGFGTTTAALAAGGNSPGKSATESYNGSSWTTISNPVSLQDYAGGTGTQTQGVLFSGYTVPGAATGATFIWNGSVWSSNPNSMATARTGSGQRAGTFSSALCCGGFIGGPTGVTAATEEFTGPGAAVTQTVTVS